MTWVAPVLAGVGALGGLFGNRPQRTTSTNTFQQGANSSLASAGHVGTGQTGFTHTALNPLAQQGYQSISDKYMNLIGADPNLTGYQASQSDQINKLSNLQSQNAQENLAARGITGPAAATSTNNIEGQRIGQQIQLSNSIPLLARQLQEATLGSAGSFYKGIPTDTYTGNNTYSDIANNQFTNNNQWGTGTTTNQYPGNQLGGLFGGLGNILGLLGGMGSFGGGSRIS